MLKNEIDERKRIPVPAVTSLPASGGTESKVSSCSKSLTDDIVSRTFQDPSICYQCGKCSAGCPVRYYMDVSPNKVVRLVQLGFFEEALTSSTPWLCAGCLACSTRCPNNFDLAGFMDALRNIAIERGVEIPEKDILKFHEAFLDQIRLHGRSYEAGLVAEYKAKTLNLFQDVDSAPSLVAKGKLSFLPHRVNDRSTMKKIFKKTGGDAADSNKDHQ